MSFSDQTNRRANSHRRTRNNHFQNNRREWVLRGSAATTTTVSPVATVDSSIQTDNGSGSGDGVGSVNRLVRPVFHNRNRNHFGPRGNTDRLINQHKQKERDRGIDSGKGKAKVVKDMNVPQLLQEIQEKLLKGSVECMICYDMVRRSASVWSCSSCYSNFHLNCTKKWARAPTSVDLLAEKNQGLNWRCPGCQSVQLVSYKDIRYVCFSGKRPDPPSDLYMTPHSCGEQCGKLLEKDVPETGMSKADLCRHVCVLQCHPGPCSPCKAFAPPRRCPCGKKVITTRCSNRKSVFTYGQTCGSSFIAGGIIVKG